MLAVRASDEEMPQRSQTRHLVSCSEHHNIAMLRQTCRELGAEKRRNLLMGYNLLIMGFLTLPVTSELPLQVPAEYRHQIDRGARSGRPGRLAHHHVSVSSQVPLTSFSFQFLTSSVVPFGSVGIQQTTTFIVRQKSLN